MAMTATLMKEIEKLPDDFAAEVLDFIVFLKSKEKPKTGKIPIESAYGIFKGIDTNFEREEEDRV